LISINIQCENKSSNVEEEKLWSLPGTFKWSNQNKDLYIDSLIEPDNLENILSLNKLLDDDSFNDTDFLVDKTNDIYIQAATKSISFNCNIQKQNVKRKSKKARPKKVWMSNNCLLLRKEVRSLGNRLAKEPNSNALRLTFCNCRREFNKLKNK